MNIERLNSLSLEALYALSEKMGLDLPAGLERVFVVEAILEAFEEDNADRRPSSDAAAHIEEKKYSGSELDEIDASIDAAPCIARYYNETVVHLVERDPEWAFAFWDVREDELDEICSAEGFSGIFLKLIKDPTYEGKGSASFEVPVGVDDRQWYLQLPEQDAQYRIDLCARCGSKARVIAHSNTIRSPRALFADALGELDPSAAELAALSGLERLEIAPPPERHPSRILGGFDV